MAPVACRRGPFHVGGDPSRLHLPHTAMPRRNPAAVVNGRISTVAAFHPVGIEAIDAAHPARREGRGHWVRIQQRIACERRREDTFASEPSKDRTSCDGAPKSAMAF
jgi:hypothetical protein